MCANHTTTTNGINAATETRKLESFTFRNDRDGREVKISAESLEWAKRNLLVRFEETAADDNWLWFWLARHFEANQPAVKTHTDAIAFLADSFVLAIGMGLKNPMIRLHFRGRRFKIYLSKPRTDRYTGKRTTGGTLCFKTGALKPVNTPESAAFAPVQMTYHAANPFHVAGCVGCTSDEAKHGEPVWSKDPTGDEEYAGCLYDGKFLPKKGRTLLPVEEEFIKRLSSDPVAFLAECSKDMGRCCYCNLPLEDKRSKDVGYGAVCAVRWGLPWGNSYTEKVPSFAQLWSRAETETRFNIRAICAAIRANPRDELAWAHLGDALEDAGYAKRPTMPERLVTMPAAR